MSYERENKLGKLNISKNVIANIAGGAATECYGVVGMASQHLLMDGIAEVLKKENFAKGIEIKQSDDGKMSIDIYLVIAYGIKISEIALEVQKKVRYVLESTLEISVTSVNVFVQDIKVIG
ncbi:Asp23/Gls24 family envelope stress response protein [Erysipelotrichaceae bacterium OttesenSCG-928-M19]|nr:Asp23/Gls24 family envelope stress response protein [Erysipelotrichaceae bacterium OttesenSCG-928-M19]